MISSVCILIFLLAEKSNAANEDCYNALGDASCEQRETNGDCTRLSAFMILNCKKICGACGIQSVANSVVKVENGRRAELKCPGFVPNYNPDNNRTWYIFTWYKAGIENALSRDQVAGLNTSTDYTWLSKDLRGRASIDRTSGALEIYETRVTDDHHYTCLFRIHTTSQIPDRAINSGIKLTITVTPSQDDLNINSNATGPVVEGQMVSYKCKVSKAKPPPETMYFTTVSNRPLTGYLRPLGGHLKIFANNDGLTSTATIEYTITASRDLHGKKLRCVYIYSTWRTIVSTEEREIYVLYESHNWTVIILSSLLGLFACATIILVICCIHFYRRRSAKQKPIDQSTTPKYHHNYEIELERQDGGHPGLAPTGSQHKY